MTLALLLFVGTLAAQRPPAVPADPGIKVGQRLPGFQLRDQNGKTQTFQSLRGSKGLMLVFFRSADW